MSKYKQTKIVCTIGPASWHPEVMRKMIDNGMNVARINGAFADNAELQRVEELIWGISADVALMLDVKGHEVRLNRFGDSIAIKAGDIIEIGCNDSYKIFPATYPELYKELPLGTLLLFDDGNVEGVLKEVSPEGVMQVEILRGELFKEGKSINTPGIHLSNPALTEKDKDQINFCKQRGWDFVAASFIRSRADAELVLAEVKDSHMKVIAKIEDQQGVDNVEEILEVVEGIMVARGDLGVEIPFKKLPLVQKEIILLCNQKGKPVITATQMLESMVNNPRPTRAEVTDVANAIIDGTDAIMLSGESSAGKYPAQAVQVMTDIALEIETHIEPENYDTRPDADVVTAALASAAFEVASELGDELKAIIVATRTGRTARLIGRFHLPQPIFAFVANDHYKRRMVLSRGLSKVMKLEAQFDDRDEAIHGIIEQVKMNQLANSGDTVLIIGSSLSNKADFPNIFEVVKL